MFMSTRNCRGSACIGFHGGNDEHPIGHDPCGILIRLSDVFPLKLGIQLQDILGSLAVCQELQENGDSNAETAYGRLPETNCRIDSDSVQLAHECSITKSGRMASYFARYLWTRPVDR